MATKLDELQVELRAIDKGLQASIAGIQQQITNFSKRADSDLSVVDKAFARGRTLALQYITVWAGLDFGKGIVNAGMQMQALENRLIAATGDLKVAGNAMTFARSESDRLGLSFKDAANSFAAFSASALRSGMTLQQTKDVFSGVAEAATALHLSPEQASSAFLALEQMASKGTVQMQELKLQLSQAIPGAFEIMAKAMNVSVAQLNKMMAAGELLSNDALPKLGAELHRQFGDVAVKAADSAQAAFNRLGNSWFDLQAKMASSGVLDTFTDGVKELTKALNDPATAEGMRQLAQGITDVGQVILTEASRIGTFLYKLGEMESKVLTIAQRFSQTARGMATFTPFAQVQFNDKMAASNATFTDRMLAQYTANQNGAGGEASSSYTLGGNNAPGETAAQAKARKAAERARKKAEELKETMSGKVDSIDRTNSRETDPQKAAALQIQQQQEDLKKALDAKAITEEEYRQKSLEAETAYQDRLTDIRQKASDLEVGMRDKALDNIMGLMQVFAGKNKAIAMAMLVFDKARAIAQAIMETHVAAAAALKYDPTGATSARVTALGYANVAAIAATGIAQLASMSVGSDSNGGGGSSSASSSGSGTTDTTTTTPAAPTKTININLQGDDSSFFSKNSIRKLIAQLNDASLDGSVLKVQAV